MLSGVRGGWRSRGDRIEAGGQETIVPFGYNAGWRKGHADTRLDPRLRQQISPFSSNLDREPGRGIELRAAASRILRAGRADHGRTGSRRRRAGINPTGGNPRAVGNRRCSRPTTARFVVRSEAANYARKADRISIRHPDGDVVAVIEIVSPGNKDSRHAIRSFVRKAVEFLQAGIHLLIVDLFPPNCRNPQGIHKVILDRLHDEAFCASARQAPYAGGVRGGSMSVYRAGGRWRHPARPTDFPHPRLLRELSPGSDLPGHLECFPGGTQVPLEPPGATPETA